MKFSIGTVVRVGRLEGKEDAQSHNCDARG